MGRVRGFRLGRKRLFAAAVLPVAGYAAEHDAWRTQELHQLRAAAIAGHGVGAPGVPHLLAAISVEPMLNACFRLPLAALERWAREVWLTTAPAERRPADALTGDELFRVFRALQSGERKVDRGPGRALLDGLRALGLEWQQPHVIVAGGSR